MPVDAAQAKILMDHLKGKTLVCPLCSNKAWHLVEVVSLPTETAGLLTHPNLNRVMSPETADKLFGEPDKPNFVSPGALIAGKDSGRRLPVAVIACSNCFFLVQLAWLPIVGRQRHG
jgi:hypothetical protein